ncbi:hypothetical protein B7W89_19025 [Agrobacterium tumefaciens]|uniref:DUF4376 domain-containing protein n=1 Tax=Agrobacterium tumefaciens TaxID=358 RepID=UPI000B4011C8|nr:hypothetical protein [Agrobacterium tumefaciens]NSY03287.1 hypothetical protein [Agrobacterium tumefaciens]OVE88016.1 hypothetical protein B7W89_19025 [Agrobacterium tumefaciens]
MFLPNNWYWRADDGRLFSSARTSLIQDDDPEFLAWLEGGINPTRWPSDDDGEQTDAALQGVLTPYGLIVASNALDAARQRRIAGLSGACEQMIISGFTSSALGAVHNYPSNIKDQLNLMGSVTDSIVPGLSEDWETPFWVRDTDGQWSWKMHTAAQIQQAGRDGKAHVVHGQTTLASLTALVLAAETQEAVEAIVWPEGASA